MADVDSELVIAMDISGSIDDSEFALMISGMSASFRDSTVQSIILAGLLGQTAVKLFFWAEEQIDQIDWTLLDSVQAMEDLADAIDLLTRPSSNSFPVGIGVQTALSEGLDYAATLIGQEYSGMRRIVNMMGDGVTNWLNDDFLPGNSEERKVLSESAGEEARDSALAGNVDNINGLAVTDNNFVFQHYLNHIVGGDDPGLFQALIDEDLVDTMVNKLVFELGTVIATVSAGCVSLTATSFGGLDHLEGENVAIMGDGKYLGTQVVVGGSITLSEAYATVHVGLPYYSDLETLNLEINSDRDTVQGRKIKVGNVDLSFVDSRDGQIGDSVETLYDAFTDLMVTRNQTQLDFNEDLTTYNSSTVLYSGHIRVPLGSQYKHGGRVFYRQTKPLPVTITSITQEATIGGAI